ncbi:MAG: DUF1667 domain-containing protein [Clostridia bacterium]|nr:DUF1667 domain-containing protein [Clostridia bacterium]
MRELTCIVCPNSCTITVDGDQITGNLCNKGRDFAISETTNPTRTITSTVVTTFDSCPALSVRTDKEIAFDKIFALIDLLKKVKVTKRVKIGDIVLANVFNSGVNVIATKNIE